MQRCIFEPFLELICNSLCKYLFFFLMIDYTSTQWILNPWLRLHYDFFFNSKFLFFDKFNTCNGGERGGGLNLRHFCWKHQEVPVELSSVLTSCTLLLFLVLTITYHLKDNLFCSQRSMLWGKHLNIFHHLCSCMSNCLGPLILHFSF